MPDIFAENKIYHQLKKKIWYKRPTTEEITVFEVEAKSVKIDQKSIFITLGVPGRAKMDFVDFASTSKCCRFFGNGPFV